MPQKGTKKQRRAAPPKRKGMDGRRIYLGGGVSLDEAERLRAGLVAKCELAKVGPGA